MTTKISEQPQPVETGGVVIGLLLDVDDQGVPEVAYPGAAKTQVRARTTVPLKRSQIGSQVALMFEGSDLARPLVIGRILSPGGVSAEPTEKVQAAVDDSVLTLSADREIVLKCGRASITLTRSGKIILKGAYVVSRSSGVNKLKGASVQIN